MSLPMLPGLSGPDEQDSGLSPNLSRFLRNPAALLALGGVALGGAGSGGSFLQGLTRGLLQGIEMRERMTLTEEQRAERKAARQRQLLLEAERVLGGIDDPDEFASTQARYRALAPEFGVSSERIDAILFPEFKRKALAKTRAEAQLKLLEQKHGAENVYGPMLDATTTVDGKDFTIRELAQIVELGVRQTVKRPVTTTIQVPVSTEDFAARHFGAKRAEQVQVGEEEVTEEIFITPRRRMTLGEYDPAVFGKVPHLVRLLVPTDSEGNPDTLKLAGLYEKAGAKSPGQAARDREENIRKQRGDILQRMNALRQDLNQAKTEGFFRGALHAWNTLVLKVRKYKGYLGFTELPRDVSREVAEWKRSRAKKHPKPDRRFLSATAALAAAEADKKAILANKPPAIDEAGLPNADALSIWRRSLDRVESRIRKAKAELKVFGAAEDVDQKDDTDDLEDFYNK